jgi:Fe-S oxidoreductase
LTKLIYLGCLSKSRYQETCKNAIKIINYLDPSYTVLDDVPCCGSLSYHIGSDIELKDHIVYVNNWFELNNISEIVTTCAGCYNYLTKYYTQFLGLNFKVKVKHLLQFLAEPDNLSKLNFLHSGKKLKVSYHDACHLRNALIPIVEEPRRILNSIENVELKEMENIETNSICCGAGGGVYSIFKENSDYNSKLIFDQLNRGKLLITACPFCFTSLTRIREKNQIKKRVIKFEDFIVNILEGVDPLCE